jgi:cobalt-zinc-cadmium efflux system outer membrane protein
MRRLSKQGSDRASAKLPAIAALILLLAAAAPLVAAQASQAVVTIPHTLTLPEAESLLLQRNLAIAVNRSQLEVAEAGKLIASYKPNPTIQLGAEQITIASPVPGAAPRFFETNSNAGANPVYTFLFAKVIERGGKREFRTKQAEATVAAVKAQILDAYRVQLLQLRQAYGAAILARLNIDLARQSLLEYEQTEGLTEKRVQAGDAPQVELYRVRSGKLPYQQALLQAESGYRQACFDVLNLLNSQRDDVVMQPAVPIAQEEPAGAALDLVGDFSDRTPILMLDELKPIALQERPDIEAARRTREAAQFGTRLAQAQLKRDISIGTEYQRVGDDSSLGLIASFPLFIYNNQKAGIAQASALERTGDLLVRQTELQAVTDVEKAWERFQAAQRALRVYSAENLQQTERLRTVAFFSYQQGATSLFELLDTQRTLLQARVGYAQARFDLQTSLWMIEAAIGRSPF